MKTKYLMTVALLMSIFGCTKQSQLVDQEIKHAYFRVLAIGNDTTYSPILGAKQEISIQEDAYLKAEYHGYINGKYRLKIKNKQNCKADIEFGYESLMIVSVSPNPKNNFYYNEIGANQTEMYDFSAMAYNGVIKVRALTICNWVCDPEWLRINLPLDVLPIKFVSSKTIRIDHNTIRLEFEIDAPQDINTLHIQKSLDGKLFEDIKVINSDKITKKYSETIKL